MDYFLFLSSAAIILWEGICFLGFLVLYLYYKKKIYIWCIILYAAYLIGTLSLYMADFLPGFNIVYNSQIESEPLIRSTLIVAYLFSYRMIIRYGLDMPVHRLELFVLAGLVLLIPLTTMFELTPLSNFLYNSYTWIYMLVFLGNAVQFGWNQKSLSSHQRFLCMVLTAMLILGILAYGETLLWLCRGIYYAQVWLQASGQHMIFTGLITVLVDGSGLWFIIQNLIQILCRPVEVVVPSPQFLEDFCTIYKLTARESEILTLLANHKKNIEIADQLNISLGTVKTHIHNIFTKTEVQSREELFQKLLHMN